MYDAYNNIEDFIKHSIAGWTYASDNEKAIINEAVDNAREYAESSTLMVDLLERYNAEFEGACEFEQYFDELDTYGLEFNQVFSILLIYGLEG